MMPTVAKALLTLHTVISLISSRAGFNHVDGLPITSKPIESTAENLAWQAWIMMPPHEQNLEKSRKVTPKSIFLLPNRVKVPMPEGQAWIAETGSGSGLYAPIECPPGQRQFESRCISTLDIDREQLLIQELQILLQHGNNNNQNTYDYDYDYDEEAIAAVEANYKPPMIFKGDELPPGSVSGNYDDAVRLPNEDAPLKFNIFSENYPTDVEFQHKQVNGMEMANVNSSYPWSLAHLFTTARAPNATIILSEIDEAQMELEKAASTSSATTAHTKELNGSFPIVGIDAIVLPAVATQPQLQKFSFFKDDSSMQLVTTVADGQSIADTATIKEQQPHEFSSQLPDLLMFDSLLPLQSPVSALSTPATTATTTTTTTTTNTTKTTTTTTPLATTATLKATTLKAQTSTTAKPLTTVTSPKNTKTASEELDAATTIIPKQLTALPVADDRVANEEQQKEEHTRSVTLSNSASTATTTATNEPETTIDLLSTTLVPNADSKQLDQATVVAEAVETVENLQKLKKSKVEPVEEKKKNTDDDLFVSQATPLPTARTVSTHQREVDHDDEQEVDHDGDDDDHNVDDDRFYYQPVDGVETTVDNVDASGQHEVGASTLPQLVSESISTTLAPTSTVVAPTTTTSTAATTMSEIDVAAELRAINELVKKSNRRQGAMKKKTTAAAKATKNEIATTITTKATSRSKTSPISEQQLAAKTENSVDFDIDATTSASSEIIATTPDIGLIVATTIATTTNAATTDETIDEAMATPTLWAKIMPLLGFGVTTITTEVPVSATSPTTTAINSSNSSNNSISSNNSSHRNSKITRINKLSTNSLSDNAKKLTTTTTPTTAITVRKTNSGSRTKAYVIPLLQATSTELPYSTTTAKATSAAGGSFSPFWWLPAGWSLDRPNSAASTITTSNNNRPDVVATEEPSLLLRFWSAFPGNQVKIKE